MKLKEKLEKSSRIFIEWNIGKLKGDDAMIELYKIFWHPYWKRVWMKHCGECGEEQNQKMSRFHYRKLCPICGKKYANVWNHMRVVHGKGMSDY